MNTEKCVRYNTMLNQWLILKQEGKTLDKYLLKCGYKRIGVYGMGLYGRHLIRDLENTDIHIDFGIDKKPMDSYKDIPVLQPIKTIPPVDVIVNSVICSRIEVESVLRCISQAPIIDLDELVFRSY